MEKNVTNVNRLHHVILNLADGDYDWLSWLVADSMIDCVRDHGMGSDVFEDLEVLYKILSSSANIPDRHSLYLRFKLANLLTSCLLTASRLYYDRTDARSVARRERIDYYYNCIWNAMNGEPCEYVACDMYSLFKPL